MRVQMGEYIIQSDQHCFQVLRRGVTQEGRLTKPENVGKVRETVLGYPGSFSQSLRYVLDRQLLDDEHLGTVEALIDLLEAQHELIEELVEPLSQELRQLTKENARLKAGAGSGNGSESSADD